MNVLLVSLGAAVGAPLRFLVERAVSARRDRGPHPSRFPWGTFTVNVAGSLVLGALLGAAATGAVAPGLVLLLGTGFCGALTTFSAFGYETLRLLETGAGRTAVLNAVGSLLAGLGAVAGGWWLGGLF